MRRHSLPPRFRSAIGLVLLAACVNDHEASCTMDGPFGPGWNYPPVTGDFVMIIAYQGAAGVGDTIRWWLSAPAGTTVSSGDSSIAAVRLESSELLVIGQTVGSTYIRAQFGALVSAADVEVVNELCSPAGSIPSLTFGQEDIVTLDDSDCALPRRSVSPSWPWSEAEQRQPPSLRAEGRRLSLAESAFIRVDVAAQGQRPYLQITADTDPVAGKMHYLDSLFLATELGPGDYVIWTATEEPRPNANLRVALRHVTACPAIATAPTALSPGDTVIGALGRTSCHTYSGHSAADFRLTVPTAGRYRLTARVLEPGAYGEVFFTRRHDLWEEYLWSDAEHEFTAGAHDLRLHSTSDIRYRVWLRSCPAVGSCE